MTLVWVALVVADVDASPDGVQSAVGFGSISIEYPDGVIQSARMI